MTGRRMVKKIFEMLDRSRGHHVTLEVTVGKKHGPVTRTLTLPNGTSLKVIRPDAFERAIGRAREVA